MLCNTVLNICLQIDKQLATGEYFLNKEQKKSKKQTEKQEKQKEAAKRRDEKRQQAFVPPEESIPTKSTKNNSIDLESLKTKIKRAQKGKLNF